MHAPSSRPVVVAGHPDPSYVATLEAEDEARAAAAALVRARRQLQDAEERHVRALANATFARCKWICGRGARS